MSIEQTKGYLRIKGKIWGLNNKEPFTNQTGSIRNLSFGIQSSKENSNYIQVGKWANSSLNIKFKSEDMEEVKEVAEQDAISEIKDVFKDGDSVYVNLRMDINTYSKSLDFLVSNIYSEKEPIDFDSPNFEETCSLKTSIIITEKPSDKKVKGGLATYKGDLIEMEFKLDDDVINNYFIENIKVGDLVPVEIYVNNKPIYEEGEEEGEERTTLKGKKIKSGGNRHITGRELEYQIVDVDQKMIQKKKYERSEIREALENTENSTNSTKNTTLENTSNQNDSSSDDDLPF